MPRTLPLNAAQLLEDVRVSWDQSTQQGTLAVTYATCYANSGTFISYPGATLVGTASLTFYAADTAPSLLTRLCEMVMAQEDLDPTQGDHLFDSHGGQLL